MAQLEARQTGPLTHDAAAGIESLRYPTAEAHIARLNPLGIVQPPSAGTARMIYLDAISSLFSNADCIT